MSLSERLRSTRALVEGLTARELSSLAGVSNAYVTQIESGIRTSPGSEALVGICRVLGCSLDWLMLGDGETPTVDRVAAAVAAARAAVAPPTEPAPAPSESGEHVAVPAEEVKPGAA